MKMVIFWGLVTSALAGIIMMDMIIATARTRAASFFIDRFLPFRMDCTRVFVQTAHTHAHFMVQTLPYRSGLRKQQILAMVQFLRFKSAKIVRWKG